MFQKIAVEEALNIDNKIFIDVRSPIEFTEATIPGAINIPILNNEERAVVGALYKEQGSYSAKIKGIEFVSRKLTYIYSQFESLAKQYKNIILFCWRGGLRSRTVANFLSSLGLKIYQLKGGYKQYRKHVVSYFEKHNLEHKFIVLHGHTGVGKTEILEKLRMSNIPILHLEELVKNSGSVFGKIYYDDNNKKITQKMFDALIFETLRSSNSKYIMVESEGQRVGGVSLPKNLFELIVNGKHILLETTLENRIKRLVNDYTNKGSDNDSLLQSAIWKLKKSIGIKNVELCITWIEESKYKKVAEKLINEYYDPLYKYSIKKYDYIMGINYENINEAVNKITELYFDLKSNPNNI